MPLRHARVLIVDDDREDAELVEELLTDVEGWNPSVRYAASYDEGLDVLRAGEVDVCLLDYRLGARSGIDFLREPAVEASGVPVILLTGVESREVDQSALEAGAADFLPKRGLTAGALERSIRYAVEQRRRRRTEARMRALQANSREVVSIVSRDGILRDVSPSIRPVLGFDPVDKIGSSVFDEVHPEDRPRAKACFLQLLDDPSGSRPYRYRVRHADGDWRVLDVWADNYLHDPDVRAIVIGGWDVTEAARQRKELEVQARLLDAVGQAVIATDGAGRVTHWNPAAEQLYGWTRGEALGRHIVELTPTQENRPMAEEILRHLAEGERWSGELRLGRKDGSTFLASIVNAPVVEAGRVEGIIGVSSDVSHLKETEEALRERLKEMRLLVQAGEIIRESDVPLEDRLRRVVEAVPAAWLHPDVTEARIVLDERTVATAGFKETPWTLSASLPLGEEPPGRLDVVLTEERPERDQGPFLEEEVDLVDALAKTLGGAVQRERSARLHARTVASLEEAVVIVDSYRNGRLIRDVNPAAERIFGYTRGELVGETTEKLHVNRASFERFGDESDPVLRAEGVFHASFPMARRDGTVFDAEQTVTLLEPRRGLDGGAVSVTRDLSEQREAEAALRRSEERFGVLSREITDVIYVMAPEGHLLYVSPSVEAQTGYTTDEFEAMNVLTLVHPDDRGRVESLLAEVVAKPSGTFRAEYRVVLREGDERRVESVARNLIDHPAVGGIVVTSRDVTERTQLEEHLRQTQKLEAIGRLAGGIAHDFNNILTVIRAQADMTLLELADARLAPDIELIRASADRAAELTSQLLAFSRDQVLLPRVVDLTQVVRRIGVMIERILGEDITIAYDLVEGLPPVEIDPGQLEQVVLNLAVNARDAMPDGGRLTLATGEDALGPDEAALLPGMTPGRYATLSVADTGVGMSEEVRARIFEPFFTTKERGKGTGLGLAMAYGVTKQSGGGIHVDSAPGQGAVFHLRFPVVEGQAEDLDDAEPVHQHGERLTGTVLVVEDDDSVRRVTGKILERAGFQVRLVGDAEEALRVFKSDTPVDVVLTDLMLPGLSGRALLEHIRETGSRVPLVLMSGYDAATPGHSGSLPRDVGFLQKPFAPDELLAAVGRALSVG